MAFAEVDTTAIEDEAFDLVFSQDRCILRLISSCCSRKSIIYMCLFVHASVSAYILRTCRILCEVIFQNLTTIFFTFR